MFPLQTCNWLHVQRPATVMGGAECSLLSMVVSFRKEQTSCAYSYSCIFLLLSGKNPRGYCWEKNTIITKASNLLPFHDASDHLAMVSTSACPALPPCSPLAAPAANHQSNLKLPTSWPLGILSPSGHTLMDTYHFLGSLIFYFNLGSVLWLVW